MEAKAQKLPGSEAVISISLSKEEFAFYIEKAFLKLSENLEIKGFRKGKVPKDIAEKTLGEERIMAEGGEIAVQESYEKAVQDNGLEPVSSPEVKIENMGDGLSFSVKVFVMPEVKLADYKKIASGISLEEKKAEDRELEATLNWIKRSRAKYSLKNFPAEKGDFAEIEYWSEDLPEIGENKKRKDAFILGEGHFFQGFEEIIPGMKSGEEKKFELEIPEDHSYKKIAGKKVRFGLKLNSLQKVEYPELNDSFAKSLGKFETIKDLEQNIKEGIKAEKESAELQKKRTEALELIAEKSEIDIPGILIDREKENLLENLKKNISQTAQVSYEEYLKQTEKTEKEIEEMLSKEALKKVKTYLVLREIGKREGVSVSDEEIEQEANDMLKHYPNPDQASKPAGVDLEKLKDYTREVIRTEKTFKIIENLLKKI